MVKKIMAIIMLSCFHLIPERHGQTDVGYRHCYVNPSHVSVLTRDKNVPGLSCYNLIHIDHFLNNFWHILSADIQKSATGIIFSIVSFHLIYVALKQYSNGNDTYSVTVSSVHLKRQLTDFGTTMRCNI